MKNEITDTSNFPEIVLMAWEKTIVDIGQFSTAEKRTLSRYVNSGILMKIEDYTYPGRKHWRYCANWDELNRRYRAAQD